MTDNPETAIDWDPPSEILTGQALADALDAARAAGVMRLGLATSSYTNIPEHAMLRVDATRYTDALHDRLADWPDLKSIALEDHPDPDGFLGRLPDDARLEQLILIGGKTPTAAFLTRLPCLYALNLQGHHLGDHGAKAIAKIMGFTTLYLSYNQIGDDGAKAIAKIKGLTTLDLSYNQIGDDGAKAIADSKGLTTLDLDNNLIGDDGAKAIADIKGLTTLCLSDNQIGEDSAKAIADIKGLTTLSLSSNQIGDDGAKAIADIKGLTNLNLYGNQIGDDGAKAIADIKGLTTLDLHNNQIGDDGAKAIADIKGLTSLHLNKNKIGDIGATALLDSFRLLSGLENRFLRLSDNQISSAVVPAFALRFSNAAGLVDAYLETIEESLGRGQVVIVRGRKSENTATLIGMIVHDLGYQTRLMNTDELVASCKAPSGRLIPSASSLLEPDRVALCVSRDEPMTAGEEPDISAVKPKLSRAAQSHPAPIFVLTLNPIPVPPSLRGLPIHPLYGLDEGARRETVRFALEWDGKPMESAATQRCAAGAASPLPRIDDQGRLDVGPNPAFDAAYEPDDLVRLPADMRRRIEDFLDAIQERNAPSLVRKQLERYRDELDYRLNDLSPATLKRFIDVLRAEMEADRDGIWYEGGRKVLLDQIIEDHETIARHFPLDSARDRMILRATLNVDAVDDPATKRRHDELADLAAEAAADGVATERLFKSLDRAREEHRDLLDLRSLPQAKRDEDDPFHVEPSDSARRRYVFGQGGFLARLEQVVLRSDKLASTRLGKWVLEEAPKWADTFFQAPPGG